MRSERKRITDNVFDVPETFQWLRRFALEMETGGKEYAEAVEYEENTAEWIQGHQELNTDEVEIITKAFYKPRYVVVPITIAFDDKTEARKASNAMGLLAARTQNSFKTLRNQVNVAMWSAQAGVSMLGMQDIVADDPTTGTLGGLNRATLDVWRNYYSATATTFLTQTGTGVYDGIAAMNTAWNNVSDGGETPDGIFMPLDIYGSYQNAMSGTGYSRFQSTNKKKAIFNGKPAFNGAPIIKESNVAANHIYFLNTEFLKFKVQSGVNLTKTPFQSPYNQLSQVAFVVLGCQMTCNKLKRQGVLTAVTA